MCFATNLQILACSFIFLGMKKVVIATGIILALAAIGLLAMQHTAPTSDKLPVTASFYPLAEFARQVGGDKVAVTTLIRPGVEPHDYDPTPKDVAKIYQSKVLVYNGAGLEPWVQKISNDAQKSGVSLVQTSKGLNLLAKTEDHSSTDPHVWMDPVLAMQQVTAIKNAFIQADPANRTTYQANAQAYLAQLKELDAAFRHGLAQCQLRDIVTSHQAFAYLAKEYGLNALAISGLSPDDEPSPQELANVANFARAHRVTHIFFETLVSPKLSQTIAREVGAQTIVFNPLEGLTPDEMRAGKNYITVQKQNLQALQTALHCE